jgi:DNA-binding response OmpR family regulator
MNPTILVADDEPNIVISLEYLLKREGYTVVIARDGEEALQIIRRERPQLVLLDVMMPKKTGFEVCQEVRADDTLQAIQILMLTAKGRDTDVAKGTALGANAYMTKPFATRDLVQKVAQMLGRAA